MVMPAQLPTLSSPSTGAAHSAGTESPPAPQTSQTLPRAPLLELSSIPVLAPSDAIHLELDGPILPPKGTSIRTFTSGGDGILYNDTLIDQDGNRTILEQAYLDLEKKFESQGKQLLYIWPKSLKAEWIDTQTGEGGISYLNSNDPEIKTIRKVYTDSKGGKENREFLYDTGKWAYRSKNLRGDGSGPTPFQGGSKRLEDLKEISEDQRKELIYKTKTPAQKIQLLRQEYLAKETDSFFSRLIQERKAELQKQLAMQDDLGKKTFLQKIIDKYSEMEKRFQKNPFAIQWALTHPIPLGTPEQMHRAFSENIQELETLVQSKKGEPLPPSPYSSVVPAIGPLVNQGINKIFKRTDDTLQLNEKEEIRDIASLNLSIPGDPDKERHLYASIQKQDKQPIKNDSLELALVKFIRAIDSGATDPEAEFIDHPMFEQLLVGIPPAEQTILKSQIRDHAQLYKTRANELKTIPTITAEQTAPDTILEFSKAAKAAAKKFP